MLKAIAIALALVAIVTVSAASTQQDQLKRFFRSSQPDRERGMRAILSTVHKVTSDKKFKAAAAARHVMSQLNEPVHGHASASGRDSHSASAGVDQWTEPSEADIMRMLPNSCKSASVMTALSNLESMDGNSEMGANIFESICPVFSTIRPCVQDLMNIFGNVGEADKILANAMFDLIEKMCQTVDGQKCYTVFMSMSEVSCDSQFPPNCRSGCQASESGNECQTTLNTGLMTTLCHGCTEMLIKALAELMAKTYKAQAMLTPQPGATPSPYRSDGNGNSGNTNLIPFEINVEGDEIQAMLSFRKGMCSTGSDGKRCVDTLGLLTVNGSQSEMTAFASDPTNDSPIAFWPNQLVSNICRNANSKMCFRKVVSASLNVLAIESKSNYRKCMRNYRATSSQCARYMAIAKWKVAMFLKQSAGICTKNPAGSSFCLSLPEQSQANHSNFAYCVRKAYAGYCTSTCQTLLSAQLKLYGCCAKIVFPVIEDNIATYSISCRSWFHGEYSNLQSACALARSKILKRKVLKLGVPFKTIETNVTLRDELKEKLTIDIASNLGIPTEYLINRKLVDASKAVYTSPTAPPTAAPAASKHGAFHQLSSSSTAFQFDIQAETDAETEAASSSFNSDVSSGATLPSSTTYLEEEGVIEPGQSAAAPAPAAGSPSSSSTGVIIGVVVAVIVVGLVVVVIVVVVMKSGGGGGNAAVATPNGDQGHAYTAMQNAQPAPNTNSGEV